MKIIGLTGGIGSGKTTVLKMFQKLGTAIFVADIEAKKLMNSDGELKLKIEKLLGEKAYLNNELNKKYIAEVVFNNKEKLAALNALVHPKVRTHFKNFAKNCKSDFIVYEAAILFESGSDKLCDFIVTVTADEKDKIERVMKRDEVSEAEVKVRMQHQLNEAFKIKNAHFVVKNTQLKQTEQQVLTAFDLIKSDC